MTNAIQSLQTSLESIKAEREEKLAEAAAGYDREIQIIEQALSDLQKGASGSNGQPTRVRSGRSKIAKTRKRSNWTDTSSKKLASSVSARWEKARKLGFNSLSELKAYEEKQAAAPKRKRNRGKAAAKKSTTRKPAVQAQG